ncbi:MAG: hypothetical protein Q7T39_24005 [Polaromonas sp.]|nr:hypothetical protein [Polaromonas sp.]
MSRVPPTEPPAPSAKSRQAEVRRGDGQRASMAQLLLVARLRARNRRDLAADSLERAAHVIFVTCKNWFLPSPDRDGQVPPAASGTPVLPPASGTPVLPPADNNTNKDLDAHRHD